MTASIDPDRRTLLAALSLVPVGVAIPAWAEEPAVGSGMDSGGGVAGIRRTLDEFGGSIDLVPIANPAKWGASPRASAAVNTAALVAAAATGKPIQWPLGEFALDPVTITIPNGSGFSMSGHSSSGTKLIQASGGIQLRMTRTNSPYGPGATSVNVEKLGFCSASLGTDYAIYSDYSSAKGLVIGSGTKTTFRDLMFGYYSDSSNYYSNAIKFYNATDSLIDNCEFRGPASGYLGTSIYYTGNLATGFPNGVNNKVRSCQMLGVANGILHDAPGEGLLCHLNTILATNGIFAKWTSIKGQETQPQVQVIGGHLNCRSRCVYTENFQGVQVEGVLLYVRGPGIGIEVRRPGALDQLAPCLISDNIMHTVGTAVDAVGINLGENVGLAMVQGNLIVNFATGIVLGPSTRACRGANASYSTPVPVQDLGSDNAVSVTNTAQF